MNSTKVHTYNQINYIISKSIVNYGMSIGIHVLYTIFSNNNNHYYLCNYTSFKLSLFIIINYQFKIKTRFNTFCNIK